MAFYPFMQRYLMAGAWENQKSDQPDYVNPEYAKAYDQFLLTYKFEQGLTGVLDKLNKLPNEAAETYKNRKDLATLKNFVTKLGHQVTGKITRKPSQLIGEGVFLAKICELLDGDKDYNEVVKDAIYRLTRDGTVWLVADSPKKGEDGMPSMKVLNRGEVINWRFSKEDNLEMIVTYEVFREENGKFGQKSYEQYKHYYMSDDGLCHIDTYRSKESKAFEIEEEVTTDFDFFPAECLRINKEAEPLLYDVAKINLRHFNHTSELDRYMTMAVLPQPLLWGCSIDDEGGYTANQPAMVLGVDEAIFFDAPKSEADFEWRELSGNSIEAKKQYIEDLEIDMVQALNQSMADQAAKASGESATAASIGNQNSAAILSIIAAATQQSFQKILEKLAKMVNEEFSGQLLINQDFTPAVDSANLPTLLNAKVQGEISQDTWLEALNASESVTIDDIEEEKAKISDERAEMDLGLEEDDDESI